MVEKGQDGARLLKSYDTVIRTMMIMMIKMITMIMMSNIKNAAIFRHLFGFYFDWDEIRDRMNVLTNAPLI